MFDKWFKKEKPFQGLAGFGGGATSRLLGASKGNQFDVTGGNATSTGGGNKYFYFTSPGNLTVASTNGDGAFEFSFMLIGAGGGGTSTGGGGGGAGAFVQKVDYPVLSIPGPSGVGPGSSVNFAVSIGSANTSPYQMPGNASTLAVPNTWSSAGPKTWTAAGGGRGNQGNGYEGGSGGGGGRNNNGTGGNPTVSAISTIDGSGNTPDTGIGSYGGDGATNNPGPGGGTGGGGGGAGGGGGDAPGSDNQPYSSIPAGFGGLGRAAFLGDTNVSPSYGTAHPSQPGRWFAGGGGGGNHMMGGPGDAPGGAAPIAGGGASGSPRNSPGFGGNPAVANTGGGGGGGGGTSNQFVGAGSAGANGICIVRVSQANISN